MSVGAIWKFQSGTTVCREQNAIKKGTASNYAHIIDASLSVASCLHDHKRAAMDPQENATKCLRASASRIR
jgi:hypothetical protein